MPLAVNHTSGISARDFGDDGSARLSQGIGGNPLKRTLISRGLGVWRTTVRRYRYPISPPARRSPMDLVESGAQA